MNAKNAALSLTLARISVWTLIMVIFLVWNLHQKKQTTRTLAIKEARSHLNKDMAYRLWASRHGGVYVPADERTPPNPHLTHLTERDIITPSGKKLTLMCAAYMLRQIMADYSELYEIKGHFTSLTPLRAQNAPDIWEHSVLNAFERGIKEVLEFTHFRGVPHLRLMQPLSVSTGCLKCHGIQGYKVGDIRGGVSISVPLLPYKIREKREIVHLVVTHTLIYLLGVGGIYLLYRGLNQRLTERLRAEAEREKLIEELQEALDEINTLKGVVPICSKCKDIRDDKGFWSRLETYIEEHSEASFSHGLCPSCMDLLYGKEDWYIKMKKNKTDE